MRPPQGLTEAQAAIGRIRGWPIMVSVGSVPPIPDAQGTAGLRRITCEALGPLPAKFRLIRPSASAIGPTSLIHCGWLKG